MMYEKKTPVRGLTFTEMAHEAGAEVRMNETARDLELAVIIGEAATLGEALAQRLRDRRRDVEGDQIKLVCVGELVSNPDGSLSIAELNTCDREDRPVPVKRDDKRQRRFWPE